MPQSTLDPLLSRTLLILAHPDDEAISAGVLLQRIREPYVLFCTDGAPRDRLFWEQYGSRENYACIRQREARDALALIGVSNICLLGGQCGRDDMFMDQDLFLGIPRAIDRISHAISQIQPQALLTNAYEGGHPDHDACSFITSVLARRHAIPAFEFPLYHRGQGSHMTTQQFIAHTGNEVTVNSTPEELGRKRAVLAAYASQQATIALFSPHVDEVFRRQHAYNYARKPHSGVLNYEAWGWCMTGAQLCAVFSAYLDWDRHKQHGPGPSGPGVREVA